MQLAPICDSTQSELLVTKSMALHASLWELQGGECTRCKGAPVSSAAGVLRGSFQSEFAPGCSAALRGEDCGICSSFRLGW